MAQEVSMHILPRSFTLTKRSNGVYYILYYQNGRQRWKSTGATTKPEALQALSRFRELLEERLQSMSFEQFSSKFLAYIEGTLAQKTVTLYRSLFKNFLHFVRKAYVNEITSETLDRYKVKRLKEVSAVSVNIELRALKAAMNTAKRWRLTATAPGVSLVRVPEQAPLSLTVEEFQKLLSIIKEHWFKELVVFAVLTGMRRGELLNLTWKDVDFERRTLTIQSRDTFRTKAGKRRSVPISQVVHQLLWARAQRGIGQYVFTLNGRRVVEYSVSHKFKCYVRRAGLSERLHFHSLRHTFATWLVQEGVSIYEVQKLMGHSSISVTETYAHLATSELHRAVNRIAVSVN
jgi:integrase